MGETAAQRESRLRRLIRNRCRVDDDDFDKAALSERRETAVIEYMTRTGYTIGMDKDYRNEWWPPEG